MCGQELLTKYNPDRILLETSGSSYPAPIAWEVSTQGAGTLGGQRNENTIELNGCDCCSVCVCGVCWFCPQLRRLAASGLPIELDAIICVIDAVNFPGYEDKSRTAKLQTQFTDLILINKHEVITRPSSTRQRQM